MTLQTVEIIDQALRYSLWGFLILFLILLLFISKQLRSRRKKIIDFYRKTEDDPEVRKASRKILAKNEWRMALQACVTAFTGAVILFLILSFVPLPFGQNFASGTSWRITPLRVTAVTYERFFEGFSLAGEVWNQTEEPLPGIQMVVRILGADEELVDEKVIEVEPDPIPPGTPASFSLRYEENSPMLRGYRFHFVDESGQPIPHVTGFDVE